MPVEISERTSDRKSMEGILKQVVKGRYRINEDGSVDVDGNVYLSDLGRMRRIPIRFGKVSGDFIYTGMGLVSLEGAPREVEGTFDCCHNRLESLRGAPEIVSGDFLCDDNRLITLEGAPREVGRNFLCERKLRFFIFSKISSSM